MRTWEIVLFALGGLRRTPLRVALTVLGVTIASGALVSMVAFSLGLQEQVETPFRTLGLLNNIEVSPSTKGDPASRPPLDEEALRRLESLDGVELAYPELRARGVRVSRGERSASCTAFALPREAVILGFLDDVLIAGSFFVSGDPRQVIIGAQLAERLGFASASEAVGEKVRLESSGLSPDDANRFALQKRELEVSIAGVYQPPGLAFRFGATAILLPMELMKEIPGSTLGGALDDIRSGRVPVPGVYPRVTVRVRDPSALPRVQRGIREMGFEARAVLDRLEEMRTFFIVVDVLLACVGTVALVVAALGIINTLLMSVLERYQEIGILKAIGASDGDLRLLFLTEAGLVGLLGGLGGLALGRIVTLGLELGVNVYARREGVSSPIDVFSFPPWLLVATVLFALLVSVVAGVYPAGRAARVDPIHALRGE